MRASWAVVAVALATACLCCSTSGTARSRLEAVQQGMTAAQVTEVLGPPLAIDCPGGRIRTELWRYDEGVLILDRGRVTYRLLTASPGT